MRPAFITRARRCLLAGGVALLAACTDPATPPSEGVHAPVTISAVLTAAQQAVVAGMSVEVTGSGIPTPIIVTLSVSGATVNGTVQVPVGASRTFTVRAFDAQGRETYDGSATADVVAGTNPPLTVRLTAIEGNVPIDVTIGTYGVTLTPTTASVAVNAQVTLTANVTTNGTTVAGPLTWGVVNPALVTLTVASDGRSAVVRGKITGVTRVVASYEGVAAASTVTVTTGGGGTNQEPTVGIQSTYTAFAGQPLTMTASGSDPDGAVVSYTWIVGASGTDRVTTTTNALTRTFTTIGDVPVTVFVTDDRGAISRGASTVVSVTYPSTIGFPVSAVSAGLDFTCALNTSGAAYCWGANESGQLGNGNLTASTRARPVTMPAGVTFTSLQSGALHTCANGSNGTMYCWGGNAYGQLGLGDTVTRAVPTAIPANTRPASMGYYFSCNAAGSGGTHQCWGRSGSSASYSLTPAVSPMPTGAQFYSITAGGYQTCRYVIFPATGPSQQQKTIDCSGIPGTVTINAGVTLGQLFVADGYACNNYASQGGMQCWGSNASGQWGNTSSGGPVALSGYFPAAFGSTFTCSGSQCSGSNANGQLGNGGASVAFGTPASITGGSVSGIAVSQGGSHACGIRSGSALFCWGLNGSGQLGDGTTTSHNVPTPVAVPLP
jgi:Regulator of chromosome condensation (RCC1) repeat/PKD domain